MVYFDVLHVCKQRTYPPLPLPERLALWLDRVDRKTRHFKRPRVLYLPQKLTEGFGLSSNVVEIDALGALWAGEDIIARTGE